MLWYDVSCLLTLQDDLEADVLTDTSYKRSWEDVCMYKQFFSELFEFDVSIDVTHSFLPVRVP